MTYLIYDIIILNDKGDLKSLTTIVYDVTYDATTSTRSVSHN